MVKPLPHKPRQQVGWKNIKMQYRKCAQIGLRNHWGLAELLGKKQINILKMEYWVAFCDAADPVNAASVDKPNRSILKRHDINF